MKEKGSDDILNNEIRVNRRIEKDSSLSVIQMFILLIVMIKADQPLIDCLSKARNFTRPDICHIIERAIFMHMSGHSKSIQSALKTEGGFLSKNNWIFDSLDEIIAASEESDAIQRNLRLDRSFYHAINSCHQSLKESLSGIRIPMTIILALGIVLPVIIATMLPIWTISSPNELMEIPASNMPPSERISNDVLGQIEFYIRSSILFFPIICLLCANYLVRDRFIINESAHDLSIYKIIALIIAIDAVFLMMALFGVPIESIMIAVTAISISVGILIDYYRRASSMRIDMSIDMLHNPEKLMSISSRLLIGEHYARAVALEYETSPCAKDFLFGAMGNHKNFLSKDESNIRILSLISETSERNPSVASQMLRDLAAHLHELDRIEKEAILELRPVAQSILATTMFLSPFVLGLISGFDYLNLFSSTDNSDFQILMPLFAAFISTMVIAGFWMIDAFGIKKENGFAAIGSWACVLISITIFYLSKTISGLIFSYH